MNPYLILGFVGVLLVSNLSTGVWFQKNGRTVERAEWVLRDNVALRLANAEITRLNNEAREKERLNAAALAQVSTRHQREVKNVRDQAKRDVAAVRAGSLVLRDPGAPSGSPAGSGIRTTDAAACRRDGQAGTDLSREASEFLLDLASEADEVVAQLTACQAVVEEDRRTLGGGAAP